MAQQGVEKKGLVRHDITRTVRMASFGGSKLNIELACLLTIQGSCNPCSGVWSHCNQVVPVSPKPRQSVHTETDSHSPGGCRPTSICTHNDRGAFIKPVPYGRRPSQGQAAAHVLESASSELEHLADCAGTEPVFCALAISGFDCELFQYRSVPNQSKFCIHMLTADRMELLPELPQ